MAEVKQTTVTQQKVEKAEARPEDLKSGLTDTRSNLLDTFLGKQPGGPQRSAPSPGLATIQIDSDGKLSAPPNTPAADLLLKAKQQGIELTFVKGDVKSEYNILVKNKTEQQQLTFSIFSSPLSPELVQGILANAMNASTPAVSTNQAPTISSTNKLDLSPGSTLRQQLEHWRTIPKSEVVEAKQQMLAALGLPPETNILITMSKENGSAINQNSIRGEIVVKTSSGDKIYMPLEFKIDPASGLASGTIGGGNIKPEELMNKANQMAQAKRELSQQYPDLEVSLNGVTTDGRMLILAEKKGSADYAAARLFEVIDNKLVPVPGVKILDRLRDGGTTFVGTDLEHPSIVFPTSFGSNHIVTYFTPKKEL